MTNKLNLRVVLLIAAVSCSSCALIGSSPSSQSSGKNKLLTDGDSQEVIKNKIQSVDLVGKQYLIAQNLMEQLGFYCSTSKKSDGKVCELVCIDDLQSSWLVSTRVFVKLTVDREERISSSTVQFTFTGP
jgi:hypothetical protein